MKYFRYDGKDNVDKGNAKEITLESAFVEIDRQPKARFNRLGLINEKGEAIEFIRWDDDRWSIDVPIYEQGEYSYCLHEDFLTTGKIKRIATLFSLGEDWRSMCKLEKR